MNVDLSVRIAGIDFKNPVLAASGTFGYGLEFAELVPLNRLGGIVTKGLSLHPLEGNPPPRMVPTGGGMLNSIGLQNVGVENFIQDKLPRLRAFNTRWIANVFGFVEDEYLEVARRLNSTAGLSALELNISCPNTNQGGIEFACDPKATFEIVRKVKAVSAALPVIVKLSPNVNDIAVFARACEQAGADALSLVNTFVGMAIDVDTFKPTFKNRVAGLSGPAIKPIALRLVYEASKSVRIPVIGMGGISTAEDAVEFLLAGATAVQVGTATFYDPQVVLKIIDGLEDFCDRKKISDIKKLIGALET